jgi:hypothetical protein
MENQHDRLIAMLEDKATQFSPDFGLLSGELSAL